MSKWGIKKFASILSDMQEARLDLINEGKDTQDMRLGQLLETAKEAVKEQFCRITVENRPETRKRKVYYGRHTIRYSARTLSSH